MSVLDIILLVCFIPAIITGISRGFVEQVAGLVSLILGTWLAFKFSNLVSSWLSPALNLDPKILHIISFIIVLLVTITLLVLLGKLISSVLNMATLGWINRSLGFLFAIFKAALLLGLLITVFEGINDSWSFVKPETLNGSPVYVALKGFALKVFPYLKSLVANV